jgi:hypothetical protein
VSAKSQEKQEQDRAARAERLQAAIATLEQRICLLEQEGEVAPRGCYVARYQARGQRGVYWYYKLQASRPIFSTTTGKRQPSRYKHLGKAGSPAHVDGVIQVVRRVQIDELQKAIDSLKQSWSELYSGSEGEGHRADK